MQPLGLRRSYTVIAPLYDPLIAAVTRPPRARSLAWLAPQPPLDVLLAGVGTGLDLPLLPAQHRYVGLDLTPAMLRRCGPRSGGRHFVAVQGDAMALPFEAASFDAVILHLILAVVPSPVACLREAARVVRPGGTLLVFDKFLKPGERAWLRRLATPLVGRIATRLDVVLEDLLGQVPEIQLLHDEPSLLGGWFRLVRLQRTNSMA
jgi:phosphatidylethanolamine/phosphatidyl-N-methylethanolamine N-methyltransferase